MTKPAGNLPTWNTGLANNTEPNGAKKTLGWEVNEKPASSYFNWWQNKVGEWVSYLNSLAGEAFVWTAQHDFERRVDILPGSGAGANEVGLSVQGKGTSFGAQFRGGASQKVAVQAEGTIRVFNDPATIKTDALTNELSYRNIVKAHGYLTTDGANAITYQDGANITSVSLPGSNVIRVTMATAMENTNYTVVVTGQYPGATKALNCNYLFKTSTTVFEFSLEDNAGATINPAAVIVHVDLIVLGP